jgi:hypothetical protein
MIPTVNVSVLDAAPVEMIDARELDRINILCHCEECAQDYTISIRKRKACGECTERLRSALAR